MTDRDDVLATVDVFAFVSYRSYLQALADAWCAEGRSLQALARHLGFSSPNFVQQLVAGKRNLTEASAAKVARGALLADLGRQYLVALVRLSRAKGPDDMKAVMTAMKRLVGRARRRSVVDSSIFDHWLYGVVFEMSKLGRFTSESDLAAAGTRVSVTPQQLRQALEFLTKRGHVAVADGKLVPVAVEFQPQNDVRRINSQQNHLKFFGLAQHRLNDELAEREFQGLTFAASEARLPELKERIRDFIKSIDQEFAEDAGGDQVLRLQLGLFKLLK